MTPPPAGLSISAMRKKAIAVTAAPGTRCTLAGGGRKHRASGCMSVALRAQHVVHSGDCESGELIRLYRGRPHSSPHLLLQAGGLLVDLVKTISIPSAEELNSLGEVAAE